jgi:hypothetical protein
MFSVEIPSLLNNFQQPLALPKKVKRISSAETVQAFGKHFEF